MKIYNTSLIKKGILLSLVLLSPEILAAESLNFNYKRADTLSLVPKLGLQARACHSKGDPMDIRVRFGNIFSSTDLNVILVVQGAAYPINYAAFSVASGKTKNTGNDTDFLVPWNVHVKGNTSGNYLHTAITPATPDDWGSTFCFVQGYGGGSGNTMGLKPFFKGSYEYDNLCAGLPLIFSTDYVWGGDPNTTPMPTHIATAITQNRNFLVDYKFHTKFIPGKPSHHITEAKDFNNSVDNTFTDNNFSYRFPVGGEDNFGVRIDNGDFIFKLKNRNISSLTLTVSSGGASESWNWKTADGDADKNKLYLNHTSAIGIKPSADDKNDPYYVNKFYKENRYYKGTLSAGTFLTQAYIDYINNVIPLSIPPASDGEINLVNTDSLTFSIGQALPSQGYGSMTFSAYGQPLKFAPLTVNGKEAASAMQVRNACY
ncbi:hypothetical protein HHY55_004662 [Salmonella enterica]|nr:hypothetical protein [Salmonella enterica]